MTYSQATLDADKAMAVKYNLLKTTYKNPKMVPIDLGVYITGSALLKSMKKEGATSCGVYWTGRVIGFTRPTNKAYIEYCEKRNAKWWADYHAGLIE